MASGVNYSFHGLFILLISFMKGNVATGLPSRRRRYRTLYLLTINNNFFSNFYAELH